MITARTKLFIPLTMLLTLLLGAGIYARIIDAYFQRDAFRLIGSVDFLGPVRLWSIYGFFRPLCSISYSIDYGIWYLNPVGYHLVQILFHSLNAYLVGILCYLLLRRSAASPGRALLPAACACFLFLVSPSHAKAVMWIPARPNLMVTFFLLSSFITYILYREEKGPLLLPASLALFVCALFSKESAISFPLVLMGYEILCRFTAAGKPARVMKPLLVPFAYVGLTALYPALRYAYHGTIMGGYALGVMSFDPRGLPAHLATAFFRSFVPYMPTEKAFDAVCLGLTVCAILALIFVRVTRKRNPPALWLFLIAAFFISLLPAAGMLAKLPVLKTLESRERFIYLPSVYTTLLIVGILHHITNRTGYFLSCILVIAAAYAPFLHGRLDRWCMETRGSKAVIEHIKAAIHANPDWRKPEEIRKIMSETYRKVTGRKDIEPEDFARIKNEYQLFDMFPPVWLEVDVHLPDGTIYEYKRR